MRRGWMGKAGRGGSQRRRCPLSHHAPAGVGCPHMNLSGASLFLLGDPFVGAGFQKIEGEGSAVEHFVVEFADVEFGAQLRNEHAKKEEGYGTIYMGVT